jgi:hypothetical protein
MLISMDLFRFPLRTEVNKMNKTRLDALGSPATAYKASDLAGHDVDGNELTRKECKPLLDRLIAVNSFRRYLTHSWSLTCFFSFRKTKLF